MTESIPVCAAADPNPRPPGFEMPPGATDCHAHVFGPADRYGYVPERNYTPPDATVAAYRSLHATLGIERGVLVQPSVYGTDNEAMLDALASLRGAGLDYRGVAVVDGGVADAELDRLSAAGVCGVRMNLLFGGGVGWSAARGMARRLAERGWHLQCLIDVSQYEDLEARLAQIPVPVVIDHMGHVAADRALSTPGFQVLLRQVGSGKCWIKLSGSYRITRQSTPPYTDVTPIAEALIRANPERMVWGSDWPHPHIAIPMPNDGDLLDMLPIWAPEAELRRRILVDNPARLYGFQEAA